VQSGLSSWEDWIGKVKVESGTPVMGWCCSVGERWTWTKAAGVNGGGGWLPEAFRAGKQKDSGVN